MTACLSLAEEFKRTYYSLSYKEFTQRRKKIDIKMSTNSTQSIMSLYLQVILRVPVRVKDNTSISSSEVNTQATSSGAQQEDKAVRIRLAEAIDGSLPQIPTNSAINSLVQVSLEGKHTTTTTNLRYASSCGHKQVISSYLENILASSPLVDEVVLQDV